MMEEKDANGNDNQELDECKGFYGFRPHDWDNPNAGKKYIKIRSTLF